MLIKLQKKNLIFFEKATIMNSVTTENASNKQNKKRSSHMAGVESAISLYMQANFTKEEMKYKKVKIVIEEENITQVQESIVIDLKKLGLGKDAFAILKEKAEENFTKEQFIQIQKEKLKINDRALVDETENGNLRPKTRRKFTEEEKKQIMEMYKKYGKTYTILSGVKEGTLNNIITAYNHQGEGSFIDKRKFNSRPFLADLDESLTNYILEKRKAFLPVSLKMIITKAKEFSSNESFRASNVWLKSFLKRNNFSLRKKTKKLMKIKEDYMKEVYLYFEKLKELRKEECLFINFDESNLCFDMSPDYTVDRIGARHVDVITHNKGKETCTIATGITSDGEFILPLIIFKYQYTGCKGTKRTVPKKYESWVNVTYPTMTRFTQSGFNKKEIMGEWILALKRKLILKSENRKVILLLDSATCHRGSEISQAIAGTNIEIVQIPGGCTGFLQPMDTSIFVHLKRSLRNKYETWLEQEQSRIVEILNGTSHLTKGKVLNGPQFSDIREWLYSSLGCVSKALIASSFATCGITYGISDSIQLNHLLNENWKRVISYLELEESKLDPYLDSEEEKLKFVLEQDDMIVLKDEQSDSDDSSDSEGGNTASLKKDNAIFEQSDDYLEINYFKENSIGKDEYEKEEQQVTLNEIKKEEDEIERKKKKVTQKRKIVEVDNKMIAQGSSVNTQVFYISLLPHFIV